MTKDDIIRMAREAGFRAGHIELYSGGLLPFIAPTSATDCMPELERFAALVVAAERNRIARAALTPSVENSSTSPDGRAAGPTASDLP